MFIAVRFHPIPFRTGSLNARTPMVLQPQGCGRVGRCGGFFFLRKDPREVKDRNTIAGSSSSSRFLKLENRFKVVQYKPIQDAGVTQLVECHLAKVDVESSNLFSRSKKKQPPRESRGGCFKFCLLEQDIYLFISWYHYPMPMKNQEFLVWQKFPVKSCNLTFFRGEKLTLRKRILDFEVLTRVSLA